MQAIERWRARGRTLPIFGHNVFVVDEGPRDAIPLLLLHGYPSSSADFEQVLPRLTERQRVVVHDHLGFGLSDKPANASYSLIEQAEVAAAVWACLGIREGHLFAHDYGTSVATELLARRERTGLSLDVRTLTLCNGSVHIELARPRPIQHLLKHPCLGPLVARASNERVFMRNLRAVLTLPVPDEELERTWALLNAQDGRAVLPRISRYLDERVRFWHRWIGALERFDRPCHVLWGDRDPVARSAVGQALAAEIPGAELTWLRGVGHYPMLEAPTRWADALLAFLGRRG